MSGQVWSVEKTKNDQIIWKNVTDLGRDGGVSGREESRVSNHIGKSCCHGTEKYPFEFWQRATSEFCENLYMEFLG